MVFAAALVATAGALAADLDIRDFGARSETGFQNHTAIQRAIDCAGAKGGGRVIVPAGSWECGSLELKSRVELHLEKGSVLVGSLDPGSYNANDAFEENFWSVGEEWSGGHLIYANKAENVAVTGEGVIDGRGPDFFGDCEEDSRWPCYKYGLKLHPLNRTWFRPGAMVAFFLCRNVRLEGVTLRNAPAWTCHLRCCNGVKISSVDIEADRTIANSDGFSIDCTRNVTVDGCVIRTGDDGFAIRASCPHHAETNYCEKIQIRDCDIWSCCYGVRIGIGTGVLRDIEISDCRIHEAADAGIGLTPAWIESARNCHIENVRFRGCRVSDCIRPVEVTGRGGDWYVRDVLFENCEFRTLLPITVTGSDICTLRFERCVRWPIDRFGVRHRRKWNEREIRNKRNVFAEVHGDGSRIVVQDCEPRPLTEAGALLMTFVGRDFAVWDEILPVLTRHGAHATFFIVGEVDGSAVAAAKRLVAAGQTVGLEWPMVRTAKRSCDVSYVPVRCLGCSEGLSLDRPLSVCSSDGFDRVFADISGELPRRKEIFIPLAAVSHRRMIPRLPFAELTDSAFRELEEAIVRLDARKEVMALKISCWDPSMLAERLDRVISFARAKGLGLLGADDLPLELER